MQTVYLAGGLRRDWRDRIKRECRGFIFCCPIDLDDTRSGDNSTKMTVDEYGIWDLHFARNADIVFGYMERINPSGIGLACELGAAYGAGKTVILVLEKDSQHFDDGKLAFMRKVADITFDNFENGVEYLKTFSVPWMKYL